MPTLAATRPDADGLLLVAEVEAYLRTIPTPVAAAPATAATGASLHHLLDQALAAPRPAAAPGQTTQAWHHPHPIPRASLTHRLLGRRPVLDITPADHLLLISAYIHHHGWTQGRLWDDTGAVCILGAQLHVLAAGYGTTHTATRARQRIGNTLGRLGAPIPVDQWNDQPSTRATDVHQLLRAAAI